MWGALGALARERWGSGALQRDGHGDGEVAAAELGRDGVARGGGVQHEGSGDKGSRRCRVWQWGSRSWPAALLGGGRRRSAPALREAERREEEEGGWTGLQILKSSRVPL